MKKLFFSLSFLISSVTLFEASEIKLNNYFETHQDKTVLSSTDQVNQDEFVLDWLEAETKRKKLGSSNAKATERFSAELEVLKFSTQRQIAFVLGIQDHNLKFVQNLAQSPPA